MLPAVNLSPGPNVVGIKLRHAAANGSAFSRRKVRHVSVVIRSEYPHAFNCVNRVCAETSQRNGVDEGTYALCSAPLIAALCAAVSRPHFLACRNVLLGVGVPGCSACWPLLRWCVASVLPIAMHCASRYGNFAWFSLSPVCSSVSLGTVVNPTM